VVYFGAILLVLWRAMAATHLRTCDRHSKICQNQANATVNPQFQAPWKKSAGIKLAASHHHFKIVTEK
jgi:hypothetical protein